VMRQARAEVLPLEDTGCHVHVGAHVLDDMPSRELFEESTGVGEAFEGDGREQLAQAFFYLQESFRPFASGSESEVRGYNRTIGWGRHYRCRSDWLNLNRHRQTVEFRLWNGSMTPWRWRMYAGISAAMVTAVADGLNPYVACERANLPLADALREWLDSETLMLMGQQLMYRATL